MDRSRTPACFGALLLALATASAGAQQVGPIQPQAAASEPRPVEEEPAVREPAAAELTPLGTPRAERPIGAADEGGSGTASSMIGGTLPALLTVIAVAVALALLLRRAARSQGGVAAALGAGGKAPSGLLEILGRYPVGRGSTLVLLRLDRRVLLLNQSAGGRWGGARFETLTEITGAEDVASILIKAGEDEGAAARARFEQALHEFESVAPVDGSDSDFDDTVSTRPAAVDSLRRRLDLLRTEGRA